MNNIKIYALYNKIKRMISIIRLNISENKQKPSRFGKFLKHIKTWPVKIAIIIFILLNIFIIFWVKLNNSIDVSRAQIYSLEGKTPREQILASEKNFSMILSLSGAKPDKNKTSLIKKAYADKIPQIKKDDWIDKQKIIKTEVYHASLKNKPVAPNVEVNIKELDQDIYELSVFRSGQRVFRPGKYELVVTLESRGVKRDIRQDFTWGVLAVNTNKSIYPENDTAKLYFGVLDDAGHTICDADLELRIKRNVILNDSEGSKNTRDSSTSQAQSQNDTEDLLSTENGKIKYSGECHQDNITDKHDYQTEYKVGQAGTYQMTLTAKTKNGEYTIQDFFEVRKTAEAPASSSDKDTSQVAERTPGTVDDSLGVASNLLPGEQSIPFDVERSGPTRINPIAEYEMQITIKANQDFNGQIIEYAPYAYGIKGEGFEKVLENDEQKLIWNTSLKKGETRILTYTFDPSDVSPELFLLGPLQLKSEILNPKSETNSNIQNSNDQNVSNFDIRASDLLFEEKRYWLLASDSVTSATFPGTAASASSAPYDDEAWATPANAGGDEGTETTAGVAAGSTSTAARYPTAETDAGGGTEGWDGVGDQVGYAGANDGSYTQITNNTFDSPDYTGLLKLQGYGFSGIVPTDATITGGEVIIEKDASADDVQDRVVQLLNASGTLFGSNLGYVDTTWTTTEEPITYGGAGNMWGLDSTTLTPAIVNDVDFGIGFQGDAVGANADLYIDYVTVKIYYSYPATFNDTEYSEILKLTNFNFSSVPAGATIDGITVAVERRTTAGNAKDALVKLYDSTGTLVGDSKADTVSNWPGTATVKTYGGAADTWNASLDRDDIVSSNFGVAIAAQATANAAIAAIDYATITINYTPTLPLLTQNHYRWRNDTNDIDETPSWIADEDNIHSAFLKSTIARLRFEIANTGAAASSYTYRLEYPAKTGGTCGDETFAAVPTDTTGDFQMADSPYFTHGTDITTSRLTPTGTWGNGESVDNTSNQTQASTINHDYYTEFEYAISPTDNATKNSTYCFRLTNASDATYFSYSAYAQATVTAATESTIAYLKFDDAQGTAAQDSTSNNNDGAFSGSPTWQTEDPCISGKCLYFPGGTSGSVTVSNTVTSVKSISFWVRPASSSAALVDLDGSKRITAASGTISATNFTSPTYYVNGKTTTSPVLTTNSWNHIVVTTGTALSASSIKIGNFQGDFLKGFMDEVKLYNYALSADQVKAELNSRGAIKGVSALLGGGQPDSSQVGGFSQGLVGYWRMDETATPSTDSSGNSNSGTWTGGAKNYTGKFGNSISQSASGDYVSVANSASLQITGALSLSVWASPSANMSIASKALIVKNNSYRMVTDGSGNPVCQIYNGTGWQTAVTSSVALTKGAWQLVTCTYDQQNIKVFINGELKGTSAVTTAVGSNTNALRIGSDEAGTYTDFFQGGLDEARVY